MSIKEELRNLKENLKTQWDELKVQAHLAKLELKDDLSEWENDWYHFESSVAQKLDKLEEEGAEALEALRKSGEKLRERLDHLKKRLKD